MNKYLLIAIITFFVISGGIVIYYSTRSTNNTGSGPTNTYKLVNDLTGKIKPGNDSVMRYYVGGDPTHGSVDYDEWDELITIDENGNTIIKAGDIIPNDCHPRRMIRLLSKNMYNSGLFVISANHIPQGLGVWPAFWLTARESPNDAWALHGEIDIIEGVNSVDLSTSINASTLHTNDNIDNGAKCRQDGVPDIIDPDCTSYDGTGFSGCGQGKQSMCPTKGCGVKLKSQNSFGFGFNKNGGGTYACELTPEGKVTIWFFEKGTEPKDLLNNQPNPSSWPQMNRTSFNSCPGQFKNLQITLNTTLCGDWAGATFDKTDKSLENCQNYIKNADLKDANWNISYIKVFMRSDVDISKDIIEEPKPYLNSKATQYKQCADGVKTANGKDMFDHPGSPCCAPCASGSVFLLRQGNNAAYYCLENKGENDDVIGTCPPRLCGYDNP